MFFGHPIFHHHLSKQKSHTKCDLLRPLSAN
nr:MAG TPA: hypothetical protein [Caudoviricetes sp.]